MLPAIPAIEAYERVSITMLAYLHYRIGQGGATHNDAYAGSLPLS
jgi:hypothetical protein